MTLPAIMRQKDIERALRAMRAVTGADGIIVLSANQISILPKSLDVPLPVHPQVEALPAQDTGQEPGVVF